MFSSMVSDDLLFQLSHDVIMKFAIIVQGLLISRNDIINFAKTKF